MPCRGVAIIAPPHSTRMTIAPGRGRIWSKGLSGGEYLLLVPGLFPKLLNTRHFRACTGFPLELKTRYNSLHTGPVKVLAWLVFASMAFHAKLRHWLGQVSCLHAADPSMM
jgi:hypothetical protein